MSIKNTVSAIVSEGVGRQGDILLVQEAADRGRFNLPGGGQKGRESLLDAVVRETQEESGLLVEPYNFLRSYHCGRTRAGNNVTRLVVACTVVAGELTPSRKHPEVDYFSDEAILELNETGRLQNGGLLQAIADYRSGMGVELAFLCPVEKH